jgi:DNA-binding protein YbaB
LSNAKYRLISEVYNMDIMKLMKQASKLKKVQKEITQAVVQDEINGVKLAMNGAGDIKNFEISQGVFDKGKNEVERAVMSVISACLKKQQDIQKEKAKEALGGINIPGMPGM